MIRSTLIKISIAVLLITPTLAQATTYTFYYAGPQKLKVVVQADTYNLAFAKAAKLCFQALTGGKYKGEEASLDIIDRCANPIKGSSSRFR